MPQRSMGGRFWTVGSRSTRLNTAYLGPLAPFERRSAHLLPRQWGLAREAEAEGVFSRRDNEDKARHREEGSVDASCTPVVVKEVQRQLCYTQAGVLICLPARGRRPRDAAVLRAAGPELAGEAIEVYATR